MTLPCRRGVEEYRVVHTYVHTLPCGLQGSAPRSCTTVVRIKTDDTLHTTEDLEEVLEKKNKRFHSKNKQHYCCNAPLNLAKFVFEPSYVQIYSKPSVFILNVFFHTIDS